MGNMRVLSSGLVAVAVVAGLTTVEASATATASVPTKVTKLKRPYATFYFSFDKVKQRSKTKVKTIEVAMDFTGNKGSKAAVLYSTPLCDGFLEYLGTNRNGDRRYRERITRGKCDTNGVWTIGAYRDTNDATQYLLKVSYLPPSKRYTVSGTLYQDVG